MCNVIMHALRNDALKINENVICVSYAYVVTFFVNDVWMKYVIGAYQ